MRSPIRRRASAYVKHWEEEKVIFVGSVVPLGHVALPGMHWTVTMSNSLPPFLPQTLMSMSTSWVAGAPVWRSPSSNLPASNRATGYWMSAAARAPYLWHWQSVEPRQLGWMRLSPTSTAPVVFDHILMSHRTRYLVMSMCTVEGRPEVSTSWTPVCLSAAVLQCNTAQPGSSSSSMIPHTWLIWLEAKRSSIASTMAATPTLGTMTRSEHQNQRPRPASPVARLRPRISSIAAVVMKVA